MNYKNYMDVLNEKLKSEIKKINLLYTNDSTKESKIRELKIEYDILKLIDEDDLKMPQALRLNRQYSKVKELVDFCSFDKKHYYADAEKFVGTINLLPFFVYKYTKSLKHNGMMVIEEKKLDKLIEKIKNNVSFGSSEENKIMSYSDYMNLLSSLIDSELKIIELGFYFDVYKGEISNAYELSKCRIVNELTEEQKINYLKRLKENLEKNNVYTSSLFAFHDIKIVPFFALKYLYEGKMGGLFITEENFIQLINEIENSLNDEDDDGKGSSDSNSMSLKP